MYDFKAAGRKAFKDNTPKLSVPSDYTPEQKAEWEEGFQAASDEADYDLAVRLEMQKRSIDGGR
jgi:hypothetical protein